MAKRKRLSIKEIKEIHKVAEKAGRWAASPEGKQRINELLLEAKECTEKLNRARQVNWRNLNRPMTI